MIPASPGTIIFSIGNLSVTWYGLCIVLAIATGLCIMFQKTKHDKQFTQSLFDVAFWSLVAGFIGARLYHVWNEWWWYKDHLGDIYKIWEGGLAIHGGILAALGVIYYVSRKKRISFFRITDLFALALPLSQAIGRWGNYFNQELFGKPLHSWWALHVESQFRPVQYVAEPTFHPLFLYEMLLTALLFSVLLVNWNRVSLQPGAATGIYAIGYGSIRFLLDFFRFDQFSFGPLTVAQWFSALVVIVGVMLIYRSKKHLTH